MKTKCRVLIYDAHCAPLRAQVEIDIFEQGGFENLGYGTTGPIPGEPTYGVEIFPRLTPVSIAVTVTDDAMKYSPNSYVNLNGSVPSRFDLTLYELPDQPGNFGGGGLGPRIIGEGNGFKGIEDIHRQIQRQGHWSTQHKHGVENLVSSYVGFVLPRFNFVDQPRDRLLRVASCWRRALERIGIPSHLLVPEPSVVHQILVR
jgi:hypothetical protein